MFKNKFGDNNSYLSLNVVDCETKKDKYIILKTKLAKKEKNMRLVYIYLAQDEFLTLSRKALIELKTENNVYNF